MIIEELEQQVEDLQNKLNKLIEFCKTSAIGSEQLWEVVYKDILKQPVPSGVDLREEIVDL
jgi:hypothetical protein